MSESQICKSCESTDFIERDESQAHVTLPQVTLHGVRAIYCAKCGARWGRHTTYGAGDVIASELIRKPRRLTPAEYRLVRRTAARTARAYARLAGLNPEAISRYENGRQPISPQADRLVRLLGGRALGDDFDTAILATIDDGDDTPLELEVELDG